VKGEWLRSRFAEDVVFALDIMQPAAYAKEGLVRREVMFSFRDVDEADGLQEFDAV
jgi:hypothetical protein